MDNCLDRFYELKTGFEKLCKECNLPIPKFSIIPIFEEKDSITKESIGFNISNAGSIDKQLKTDFVKWLIEIYNFDKSDKAFEAITDYISKNVSTCELSKLCCILSIIKILKIK